MAPLGQTITIVNKSGKIVSTSKHLINVFNEAKAAYNERKAELKGLKKGEQDVKEPEGLTRSRLESLNLAGDEERRPRRSPKREGDESRQLRRKPVPSYNDRRPPVERSVSDSFYTNDLSFDRPRRSPHRQSRLRDDTSSLAYGDDPRMGELMRRNTDGMQLQRRRPDTPPRSASLDGIDMDLAYGELPPPLPARKYSDEAELRSKMNGLQRLLDECNCLQHSAMAIIDNLQKNPDAMAAVALTLAEISNIASKMAPGALTAMKGSFPAIVALLASPEFAIAVGVGVGVTIIAFGGYKIIKKIKAKNEARALENGLEVPKRPESPIDEGDQLREINRIESWRRGIADAESESLCTSVEGEFITPRATRTLMEEGKLTEANLKPSSSNSGRRHRRKRAKSDASGSKTKSKGASRPKARKEPSGLRMLFKGSSS